MEWHRVYKDFQQFPCNPDLSKNLKHKSANTVIFHSADEYITSLPLKTIADKNIILAYASNNIVLPASLGFPFIVVAADKLGYKWARRVNEIELSDNPDYKGYRESTGYDHEADAPD